MPDRTGGVCPGLRGKGGGVDAPDHEAHRPENALLCDILWLVGPVRPNMMMLKPATDQTCA